MRNKIITLLAVLSFIFILVPMRASAENSFTKMDINGAYNVDLSTSKYGAGWSWDASSGTLTLDGFTASSFIKVYGSGNLIINLLNDNSITQSSMNIWGIQADNASITFTGTGNLSTSVSGKAVNCGGDVTFAGSGTYSLFSEDNAIYTGGDVIFAGSGKVTISGYYNGIYMTTSGKKMYMNGSESLINILSDDNSTGRALYNSEDGNSPLAGEKQADFYYISGTKPEDKHIAFQHYKPAADLTLTAIEPVFKGNCGSNLSPSYGYVSLKEYKSNGSEYEGEYYEQGSYYVVLTVKPRTGEKFYKDTVVNVTGYTDLIDQTDTSWRRIDVYGNLIITSKVFTIVAPLSVDGVGYSKKDLENHVHGEAFCWEWDESTQTLIVNSVVDEIISQGDLKLKLEANATVNHSKIEAKGDIIISGSGKISASHCIEAGSSITITDTASVKINAASSGSAIVFSDPNGTLYLNGSGELLIQSYTKVVNTENVSGTSLSRYYVTKELILNKKVITGVNINRYLEPQVGGLVSTLTVDNADECTVAITWKDESDQVVEYANYGHTYTATITVTPIDGYTFVESTVPVDLSGVEGAISSRELQDGNLIIKTRAYDMGERPEPDPEHVHKYYYKIDGNKKIGICECGDTITEILPKDDAEYIDNVIIKKKTDTDVSGSVFGKVCARIYKAASTSVTIKWNGVSGATSYKIYAAHCNTSSKKYQLKLVKKAGKSTRSYKYTGLKKGNYYKFIVMAVKGTKALSTSKTIHIATTGGKYTNAKSMTLNVKSISVKKGRTKTIKVKKTTRYNSKLKLAAHRAVKYETSNSKIATVSAKGVVKGVKKGTCYVYVYAQDGIYKKIKIVCQ